MGFTFFDGGTIHNSLGDGEHKTTLREIEWYYLSPRLAVTMVLHSMLSLPWTLGLLELIGTAAINPVIQFSVEIVQRPVIREFIELAFHVQLDRSSACL